MRRLSTLALATLLASPVMAQTPEVARGVVVANERAAISVSLSEPVRSLPFREGEHFAKGDTLIELDCAAHRARLRAAEAAYRVEQLTVANNLRLLKHQAIGANQVAVSRARMAKSRAEADALAALIRQCRIKAPYDGAVVERRVAPNETTAPGKVLITIVDTSRLEAALIAPSSWLVWLKRGSKFSFRVDETGETLAATVVRIGAGVDAASQTVKVFAELETSTRSVLPGMSGTASFARPGS